MRLRKAITLTPSNGTIPVVIYARVSSKEQEREGFSIPAQLTLLRDYAARNGMTVMREFVDVESASTSGRTNFGEMLGYLKAKQRSCRTVLVEKTDRLYRNITDYSTVDQLGVTVHFVKENQIISPDSRSSDHFMHGMKVLMARNYSQNLGEETLKGMRQKARDGLYPSFAPVGYRNCEGPAGKRTIVPDNDAPIITRLFEEFATGQYSLKSLAAKARGEGWTVRGRRMHTSTLHQILRKRIYSGDFDWNGETYQGTYELLVTREMWESVQAILDRRIATKQRRIKRDFVFTGFVQCGHCGCAMVAELKKGRYIYYHCTGYLGKCGEPYTREEALENQFAASLRDLVIPKEVLAWLREEIVESDLSERAARDRELNRLEEQRRRIQNKMDLLYEDRLEGRLSAAMYDQKAAEARMCEVDIQRRIDALRSSQPAAIAECIDLMGLTSRAAELFQAQPPHEKQQFLQLVLKSATWLAGELRTEFEQPFEAIRLSNQLTQTKKGRITCRMPQVKFGSPKRRFSNCFSTCNHMKTQPLPGGRCCNGLPTGPQIRKFGITMATTGFAVGCPSGKAV